MECEHVEFTADGPEQCNKPASPRRVGGVRVSLCDEHAAWARHDHPTVDTPRGGNTV